MKIKKLLSYCLLLGIALGPMTIPMLQTNTHDISSRWRPRNGRWHDDRDQLSFAVYIRGLGHQVQ